MEDRRFRRTINEQISWLGPLMVVWAFGMGILWSAANQRRVPLDELFLDPSMLSGRPWYAGILHDAGVFCWSVASVSAIGGAWIAKITGRTKASVFLATGGALSMILFSDELLEIHARLAPAVGIPKSATVLALVTLAAVWALVFIAQISRTRWMILMAALVALATSVVVDHYRPGTNLTIFTEDAPKLLGEMAWATYFVTTASDITRSAVGVAPKRKRPPS